MFSASSGGSGDGGGASITASSSFAGGIGSQLGISGGTSVYPPQPYAPQASTSSAQQQPHRQFARTDSSSNLQTNNNSNHQGGPSNAPTPQLTSFASPSVRSSAKMDGQASTSSNGNNVASSNTGGTRKRGPSTSPGAGPSETKEKKARPGEPGEGANSTGHTRTTSSVNGAPVPDGRHWGEEANKLDVYVWDYLTRRGFQRAAKNLLNEAGLTGTPDVPLKTPQGLLFEYWGVFWDVFAARSGRGSADATTYYDVQEQKLANKINETARRSEAMEAQFAIPTLQTRFPQILVNAQQSANAAANAMHAPGSSVGRPLNGQIPAQVSQATPVSQAQPQAQQLQNFHHALGRPSGAPQQPTQSPVSTAVPQQQQQQQPAPQQANAQQLLMLAAQRHNVPVEELDKLNPQMRAALIQSVAAGQAQNQNVLGNVRPGPGPIAGNGSPAVPGIDPAAFQRMQQQQQQQALQRQMQRGNPQQPLRPGMMGVMQGQQPGTPGIDGVADGRRSVGPQQGQGMPSVQTPGPLQQPNAQGQPFGPQSVQRPGPMRPVGATEGQPAPRLSTEQHQILLNQYASLQQTLRQELFQIENAPTMDVKQRATQSAQQTQMRLQQLGSILKAQPNLQGQPGAQVPQQQAQQARPMQVRPPGQPQQMAPGMQGNAGPFRPGMTPQQQQQLMYAQQQQQQQQLQQQQQQRMSQPPGTPQQNNRGMPGMGGSDPSVMMAAMGPASGNAMNGQQQQQVQQSPQQGGNDLQSQQQRGQFAFANPFAAGAGQVGTPNSMQTMRRPSGSQDAGDSSFQQPYAAAQTPRPSMPQRVLSGMGPPNSQHISSPSPRLPQGSMLQQDGSIVGSPATIPSTPRATGAASGLPGSATGTDKKKKDSRSRKNSKAVSAANKTPVLGAASVSGATPQAPTPASVNQPTPGPDQHAQSQNAARPSTGEQQQQNQNQNMSGQQASTSVFGTPMSAVLGSNNNLGNLNADSSNQNGNGQDNASNGVDGQNSAGNPPPSATDDLSQMFGSNNDMSQFLDFEFNGGGSAFGGDSTSNDAWDSSNLNALFGDSLS